MAFEKGKEKTGGREKNVPNKRTTAIRDYMELRKVSPAHFCIDLLAGDTEAIGKDVITFEDKQWAIETLLPYVEGKRKPVDSTGDDSSSVISDIMDFIDASKR